MSDEEARLREVEKKIEVLLERLTNFTENTDKQIVSIKVISALLLAAVLGRELLEKALLAFFP